jgi:16S rRNA (cytidine1402-2'-O)-methyltransferase
MGTLYLVATPIGNLEDISTRALRTLQKVRMIAAEDTRQTKKLLTHFDIHTPMVSYHEHNKGMRAGHILAALQEGDVALVSDAGTPALNDPGYELVRAALQEGHQVSPIPGACAPVAALVASGMPTDAFLYLGYLPRKPSERRRFLMEVSQQPYTLIFLETPHRLLAALSDLTDTLGDRDIAVARELTKRHEEIVRGSLSEIRAYFSDHTPRGELTLVVAGKSDLPERWSEDRLRQALGKRLSAERAEKLSAARLAGEVAAESGWPRRAVYQLILELKDGGE